MRHLILAFLMPCFVIAPGGASASESPDPRDVLRRDFHRKARELQESVDGVFGLVVKDLVSGDTLALHPDIVFTQASVIKIPILVELYAQAEAGKLDPDAVVALNAEDMVGGAGVLRMLTPGKVGMTVRDLAVLMIVLSDNTATNALIDRLGMDNINARMAELGLGETKVRRKMMDRTARLENRENVSTPREMALLLEKLHRREILSPSSCDEILSILALPKEGRISRKLPEGVSVANKTGSVAGVVNDVGIVQLAERPFIVSAMINWHLDSAAAEEAIAEVSRLAYSYFERIENSNDFGHRK